MAKALEKPKLFLNTKEFMVFSVVILILLLFRLGFLYMAYEKFVSKPFYYTYADVITSYIKTKNHKKYTVLKLRSDEGFTFYTTSHRKEDFNHKRLRLQLFPNKSISFRSYLGTFYVKSKIKKQEYKDQDTKAMLLKKVEQQHSDANIASFFNAIFFATPLQQSLRKKVSLLGVSHLVALSGFHLAILWSIVYGILLFLYRPLQQHYFPYRHALFDVGLVAMICLGLYVWFVDAPPSLVRSYAMVLVGWGAVLLGLELLSFTLLGAVFLVLVLLSPALLVSLSFWLSVAGVFYIFLLLQYTTKFSTRLITLFFIPMGIFILMLPVVHGIFGTTSFYQLLSPILSLLFVPFYPLMIGLHLYGFGDILDDILLVLFSLPKESKEMLLPLWIVGSYIGLSLLCIRYRQLFYVLLGLAGCYGFYLFVSMI